MAFITFDDVSKTYSMGTVLVHAVNHLSFEIEQGELCVIVGPSGAGKTTVLNMLGGMDSPTEGKICLADIEVDKLNAKGLTQYRRNQIGFVFQFYNLIQNLTARENVELATQICKHPLDVETVLEEVGLKERMNNFPAQLSGGEQQRVAIARALAKNSELLLCDEPTGALDYETGRQILKLLQDTCKNEKRTVIIVTHNSAFAHIAHRVIEIRNGRAESITLNATPQDAQLLEW